MSNHQTLIPEPEIVYHYTTVDTMMKIVRSGSIWATSISYLNDVSERDHYLGLVRSRIPALLESGEVHNPAVFEKLLDDTDLGFATRPFVASFSRDSDSLPQWRSYCPNGNGISIGFRVECLKRAFVKPAPDKKGNVIFSPKVTYIPIEYLDSRSPTAIDLDIVKAVAAATVASHKMNNEKGDNSTPADYFGAFLERRACFVKHASFENEHEYRLLADGVFWNLHHLEFRATRSSLVPYISVHIPRRHSAVKEVDSTVHMSPLAGRWDFIDRVVVGPTTNKNLTLEAVRAFFRKEMLNVEVVSSDVPYRDW